MPGIRQAHLGDAAIIAAIEVETWRATYAGTLADTLLLGMSAEGKARQWAGQLRHGTEGVWVWENEDRGVLGFGHCGRQRMRSLAYAGEITMLYVWPDAQEQGIGRSLVLAMFSDLRVRGMASALVWVLAANPSRFFYARLGGKLVAHRPIEMAACQVEALGYGWSDLDPARIKRIDRSDKNYELDE